MFDIVFGPLKNASFATDGLQSSSTILLHKEACVKQLVDGLFFCRYIGCMAFLQYEPMLVDMVSVYSACIIPAVTPVPTDNVINARYCNNCPIM